MAEVRLTLSEYCEYVGRTVRWGQMKCKAGESLPGIHYYEKWQRDWILYAVKDWESVAEKYFDKFAKKIC